MIDEHKVWIRGVEGRGSEVRKMLVDLGATTQLEPKDFDGPNVIGYYTPFAHTKCDWYISKNTDHGADLSHFEI